MLIPLLFAFSGNRTILILGFGSRTSYPLPVSIHVPLFSVVLPSHRLAFHR